jgi:hypothetical protein
MYAVLLEDIFSYGKGCKLYGKKNDKVLIISVRMNVLIVEGKNNDRFPVHLDRVKILDDGKPGR